ncbi:MAG: hypothetical protein H8D38_04175 [DPANN group archaeon]|nr:hypothetical protein [DPANN group archaeon]
MKRKVNRVGKNTLTVSLPSKWVKKYGLKSGKEVEVTEQGRNLIISSKTFIKKIKRVNLNIDGFNKHMLNRHLDEFYRQGVEEIVLKFTKETIPDYKYNKDIRIHRYVRKVIERFIGLEIISRATNKIVLQSLITKEEWEKTSVTQNRIYFLIKEFFDEFVLAMDDDFKKFHDKSYDYHDSIVKFSAYYLRLLNFSEWSENKKIRMFGLIVIIDKIIDKVRHTSERVEEMKKITPKIKKYVKEIFDLFIEQFEMINKKNYPVEDLNKLIRKRYDLVNRVNTEKFNEEELKVISECNIILDTINDFSEAHITLFEDYR